MRYCFIYSLGYEQVQQQHPVGSDHHVQGQEKHSQASAQSVLKLTRVTDSCHRIVSPGSGIWAYNFTNTGMKNLTG